jgi:general secretion pathway protein D
MLGGWIITTSREAGRASRAGRASTLAICLAAVSLTSADRRPLHAQELGSASGVAAVRRTGPAAAQPPSSSLPAPGVAPAGTPVKVVRPESPKVPLAESLNKPGDVTFRNMTLDAALFTIGETWKVNIIAGKEIQGTANGVFKQTPLREILDAVLLANGYSYRTVGESLVVQKAGEVGSANPLFQSLTVPIKHSNLDEIVEGAKLLISATGQIKPLPSARSILVLDYADRVESVAAFIARMEDAAAQNVTGVASKPDATLDVAYFHTHFVPVSSVQQPLASVLSPMGRLGVMPRENRILVVDYSANIEMVRKVLERIDRPRPQVRITALIYDLSLEDVEQLGLNWGSAGKGDNLDDDGNPQQALEFETRTIAPFTGTSPGGAFTVRSLTRNFDITTVLNLLQNASDARLLADPNVTVADNEQAEWKSVSEIPYQQITQSELGGQIGTTAFKEAGVTLRVLPTIAGDGTIEMTVEPEFSRLAGFTPQENQPIIDTRKATTRVRVANRQTIVIGGLRQRSDTGEFNGIPWLKDVKYVGSLFRSRDTNVRESELIVFIMPEIIGYDEPADCREASALETIGCRLEAIPGAEGCPGDGCTDGCAGQLIELPSPGESTEGDEAAPPVETQPAASAAPNPMRPSFDQRYRADGSRRRSAAADAPKTDEKKGSAWSRMFRK